MSSFSKTATPQIDLDALGAMTDAAWTKWAALLKVHCCYKCKATPYVEPTNLVMVHDRDDRLSGYRVDGHKVFDNEWGRLSWEEEYEKKNFRGESEGRHRRKRNEPLCPDCINIAQFEAGDVDGANPK